MKENVGWCTHQQNDRHIRTVKEFVNEIMKFRL